MFAFSIWSCRVVELSRSNKWKQNPGKEGEGVPAGSSFCIYSETVSRERGGRKSRSGEWEANIYVEQLALEALGERRYRSHSESRTLVGYIDGCVRGYCLVAGRYSEV